MAWADLEREMPCRVFDYLRPYRVHDRCAIVCKHWSSVVPLRPWARLDKYLVAHILSYLPADRLRGRCAVVSKRWSLAVPLRPWARLDKDIVALFLAYLPSERVRVRCSAVCKRWRFVATLRPWAGMNEDIVEQIFSALASIGDRACFSGVCTNWRFFAVQQEMQGRALLPWLLRPSTTGTSYFRVFSGHTIPYSLRGGARRRRALIILSATLSALPNPDGDYIVAAISCGECNLAFWEPGMVDWSPGLLAEEVNDENRALHHRITVENVYEDLIYYQCRVVGGGGGGGVFFLTSQETVTVFEHGHAPDGTMTMQGRDYPFHDHHMTAPGDGEVIAGRYLIKFASGRLLMVKRFASADPGIGTNSFQIFTLQWANKGRTQCWQMRCRIGTEKGFRDTQTILCAQKQYECKDTGRFCYFTRTIHKRWGQGPRSDCSPCTWFFR
ncbi:hypothetical protein QOZ80_2BG0164740 [Eleusine coracana subsp. coracana]|nr:hypothetical protein QOZ80_2BG0164740 [Eleusine coracana subsp. coracana]